MEHGTLNTVPGSPVPPPPLRGEAGAPADPGVRLLRQDARPGDPEKRQGSEVRLANRRREGRHLLCALCGRRITHTGERIRVQGSHGHTFANPHGHVFRIGCFGAAPGCRRASQETEDYTWFPGYAWSIQVCAGCFAHLGWEFRSARDGFHGLILDRLVEEGRDGDRD